jgi:hypothetical protein
MKTSIFGRYLYLNHKDRNYVDKQINYAWLILSLSEALKLKNLNLFLCHSFFIYIYIFPPSQRVYLFLLISTQSVILTNTLIQQQKKVLLVVPFHRFVSFISYCSSCTHVHVRLLYLTYILMMVFLYICILEE